MINFKDDKIIFYLWGKGLRFFIFLFFAFNLFSFQIKKVELSKELEINLYILPEGGDSYIKISEKLLKDPKDWKKIKEINKFEFPLKGIALKIPFEFLKEDLKVDALRNIFLDDKYNWDGIFHKCKSETLWHIALWYTGDGKNYKILKEENNLASFEIKENQEIFIPEKILLKSFKKFLPEKPKEEKKEEIKEEVPNLIEPKIDTSNGEKLLAFPEGKDYAIYVLKKGEALYSSVVVRFTGIDDAQEVINLAQEIAKNSGIEDVTKIPANYPIKIPKDLILPKYLPKESLERQEWERREKEVEEAFEPVEAPKLEGVYIILDAGHGGSDTGAIAGGVWEATYTYDIYNRLYNLLTEKTEAKVIPLVQDKKSKFKVIDRDVLPQHRSHIILSNPPEKLNDSQKGVNMRWKLANMNYSRLINEKVDKNKILFISIHSDALHQSIRGATFYIPGASYMKALWGEEAIEGESQSRKLAKELLKSFKNNEINLHPYEPIREKIIRYKKYWLPAVLKMNLVPTKILIEILNLNNEEDRKNLLSKEFREKLSQAIFDGIVSYFQKNNE